MISLIAILKAKIAKLDTQIASAKFDRDSSATPMESHSDKSRQIAEQLMDALQDEKKQLLLLKNKINQIKSLSVYTLSTPLGDKCYCIVPEGLGGQTIDVITLISENSPLAQKVVSIPVGGSFDLNDQTFTLIQITPILI